MSTRPVTGRVGFGGGGPPRRRATPGSNGVSSARSPRARALLSPRVSAAYASLISAIRRVARRDAAGSSPVRSGWLVRASRRQAALIWVAEAPTSTPRTSCGSRLVITPESRARPTRGPGRPAGRLDRFAEVPSPTGSMSILRRAGIAAAAGRCAARARLPLRARLPGPGGLSAPQPAADHAGRHRPALRVDAHRVRRAAAPRLVHPGAGRRTRSGRRPGPRLGVGPRPDPSDGRLPQRRGLPLPDPRHPRQRGQPGRGPAAQRRRVRGRCAGRRSTR